MLSPPAAPPAEWAWLRCRRSQQSLESQQLTLAVGAQFLSQTPVGSSRNPAQSGGGNHMLQMPLHRQGCS